MSEPRYRPLSRLAAGGMAEVYIAEATGVQGFKKKVAIKRVLPHLASNKNFMGMFLDEARLGARMSHANCVSVFDIGTADNTYFLVMEFVEGCDLKTLIDYHKNLGEPVPLRVAVYVIMEACRGLAYAHDLTDDDGNLLHIVHRDISPPNILISRRGEVKVTDFGLAKASTQLEKTDPGVVKGKFAYLAPEAVNGEEVDARADVFAAATVLWEMVSGRRLFLGDTDYQTLKLVAAAKVPSLVGTAPEVDEEFEAILHRALARKREDRYQTAADFGDALAGYLFEHRLKVTSYDLAKRIKLAIDAADRAKPKQSAVANLIDQLIQEELMRFTSLDPTKDDKAPTPESEGADGSKPLDMGDLVNPASWLDGEDLGSGLDLGEGGWRESGLLDSSDGSPSLTDATRPFSTEQEAAAARGEAPAPIDGGDGGTSTNTSVVVAVVAAAAAVGAAFAIFR